MHTCKVIKLKVRQHANNLRSSARAILACIEILNTSISFNIIEDDVTNFINNNDSINLLIISICWVYFNFSSSSSVPELHGDVIDAPPLGLRQVDEQIDP